MDRESSSFQVLGYGAPIVDLVLSVDEPFLRALAGERGGMELVSYETIEEILGRASSHPTVVPGGSTSNVLRGLASLDHVCAIIGKVGRDSLGKQYKNSMRHLGINGFLLETDSPTSIALSLVDGQGQRTMRTFIGASGQIEPEEIDPAIFQKAQLLHVEGYALFNFAPAQRSIDLAKAHKAKVSFDLASFEVVRQFKEELISVLSSDVDIVFANEDEARILTGKKEPQEACDWLSHLCETAVVMMGRKGCVARRGGERVQVPAYLVDHPVDTTGAGDLFASGWLHGVLHSNSLERCAHVAALTAAEVVKVRGAVIPPIGWERVRRSIEHLSI